MGGWVGGPVGGSGKVGGLANWWAGASRNGGTSHKRWNIGLGMDVHCRQRTGFKETFPYHNPLESRHVRQHSIASCYTEAAFECLLLHRGSIRLPLVTQRQHSIASCYTEAAFECLKLHRGLKLVVHRFLCVGAQAWLCGFASMLSLRLLRPVSKHPASGRSSMPSDEGRSSMPSDEGRSSMPSDEGVCQHFGPGSVAQPVVCSSHLVFFIRIIPSPFLL